MHTVNRNAIVIGLPRAMQFKARVQLHGIFHGTKQMMRNNFKHTDLRLLCISVQNVR